MLPKDWKIKTVKELATITTGNRDTQNKVMGGKYPFFVRSQNIERINSFSYDGVAVLTAGDGVGVGKVFHYIDGKFDFHQRVYKISEFSPEIFPRFFFEYFKQYFMQEVCKYTAKTSVDSVRMEMISNMEIPVPPILEQQKISRLFSVWDLAIEKQTELIAEKKSRKKELMRKLLSGEIRSKGCKGSWEEKSFGEIFEFISSTPLSREQLVIEPTKQKIMTIHYGDIHSKFKHSMLDLDNTPDLPYIKDEIIDIKQVNLLKEGDLIIADASEDYAGVGSCIEIKNIGKKKVTGGLHVFIARAKNKLTSPGYRAYILKSPVVAKELKKIATGVSVYSISKTNLAALKIMLPSENEQRKIASILHSLELEITNSEMQLEKLILQKRGIAVKLLTGKMRIKK